MNEPNAPDAESSMLRHSKQHLNSVCPICAAGWHEVWVCCPACDCEEGHTDPATKEWVNCDYCEGAGGMHLWLCPNEHYPENRYRKEGPIHD